MASAGVKSAKRCAAGAGNTQNEAGLKVHDEFACPTAPHWDVHPPQGRKGMLRRDGSIVGEQQLSATSSTFQDVAHGDPFLLYLVPGVLVVGIVSLAFGSHRGGGFSPAYG
jgi:hypothetical protein